MSENQLTSEERAQLLLKKELSMHLVRSLKIEHSFTLSERKSVDLVKYVIRALRAIQRENTRQAENQLSELLAVLISHSLDLNEALGLELLVREDYLRVRSMALRICRDEALMHIEADSERNSTDPSQNHRIERSPNECDKSAPVEEEINKTHE